VSRLQFSIILKIRIRKHGKSLMDQERRENLKSRQSLVVIVTTPRALCDLQNDNNSTRSDIILRGQDYLYMSERIRCVFYNKIS
jgi:hypothetical protein